jgi:heat shock protein HslJ
MRSRPRQAQPHVGRMSTIRLALLILTSGTLSAAACADNGDIERSDGGGAIEGRGLGSPTRVDRRARSGGPDDARVDLVFADGQISGKSGCNQYGGPYEVDGTAISFGDLFGTTIACEQPLMNLESAYMGALDEVDEYQLGTDELMLTGECVRLGFDAEHAPEPLALVRTVWMLEAISVGSDAVASPLAGTEVTLELHADGSAGGSGGCNTFTSGFETEGQSIHFDPVASTRMACEPDVMDQEAAVFNGLESAAAFEIDGDLLTLRDADRRFLLSFRGTD